MAGMENHMRSTSNGWDRSGSVYGNPAATAYSAGDRQAAASPEVADSLINGDGDQACCPGEEAKKRVFYLSEEDLTNQVSY